MHRPTDTARIKQLATSLGILGAANTTRAGPVDTRRVIGLDVGSVFIGVAVSTLGNCSATPLNVVRRKIYENSPGNRLKKFVRAEELRRFSARYRPILDIAQGLSQISSTYNAAAFCVGYPLTKDGMEDDRTRDVKRFCTELQAPHVLALYPALRVPFFLWDERYSTHEVRQTMREFKLQLTGAEQKEHEDTMAAALVLEEFLLHMRALR